MANEPTIGGLIHEKMVAILRDTAAIGKDMTNQQQGFKFRGIDQVYNDMHPIFATHGVYLRPVVEDHVYFEQTTKSGGISWHHFLRVRFWFTAEDGSAVDVVSFGEATDSGDKGVNKCMSIALKYALFQALLIPTKEEKDPDAFTNEASGVRRRGAKYTAEQQQVVAQKLSAFGGPASPPIPPPEPPLPPGDKKKGTPLYEALKAFQEMKKKIGEKEYYYILGNNGYEKSNEITDIDVARKIFRQMAEATKAAVAAEDEAGKA